MKYFLLFYFTIISQIFKTMANDFDCPIGCDCRTSFNNFYIICKTNGKDVFAMEYSNLDPGDMSNNRQLLRLICYTKSDFYEFLPELKLSPYISVQFYNCDINQTSIRRLEVRLFEDRSENLLNLEVSHNYFDMLSGFEKFPHLEMLSFFHNTITDIDPKLLHPMTNLRRLYLINNNITHLPSRLLKSNRRLEKITIEEMTLPELPDAFLAHFSSLNYVELECRLEYLSENLFKGSKAIEKLYIRYNDLWKIPVDLFEDQGNLTELSLESNHLVMLSDGVFRNLRKLSTLNLRNNRLRNISENLFDGLENLEALILSNNLLHTIHVNALAQNTLIRHLDLQNNHLHFTSMNNTMFAPLKYLKKLFLQNNHITDFHFTWLKKKYHFELLDLSGNDINKLHLKELPVIPIEDASKEIVIDLGWQKVNEISVPERNMNLYSYAIFELITYSVKMIHNLHIMQAFNDTAEEIVKNFIKFEFYKN